jgi:hypothetical protein
MRDPVAVADLELAVASDWRSIVKYQNFLHRITLNSLNRVSESLVYLAVELWCNFQIMYIFYHNVTS